MATRHWLAFSVAVLSSTVGCATGSSMWPSSWFGGGSTPKGNLSQYNARNSSPANPSRQGANAQLGAPAAAAAGPLAGMTASFKKWTGSDEPAKPEDPISLNSTPKQLSPEFHMQVARMHEAKGDFVNAIKQYEQAIALAPKNTDVLVSLGRAYDRSGDMQKAVETYQRAIKIDARCALAYNDLGLCYARQHDMARAKENLDRAVALTPTSKLYRNNLATMLVQARQYNEAYDQLAAVNPPAVAQYNLGVLANRNGNKAEAMNRFKAAAAADPSLVQARNMIDKLSGAPPRQGGDQPVVDPDLRASLGSTVNATTQQPRQMQTQLRDGARQTQDAWRDEARQMQAGWKNQAQSQFQQVKTQVNQTQSQLTEQAQSQARNVESRVSEGVNQTGNATQSAIRDAEAKIRSALQPQAAPVAPAYGDAWVPPQGEDITPIQGGGAGEEGESTYSISDDDDSPVLLPPTGE